MTKHGERPRNFDFMSWVKTQPCLLRDVDGAGDCEGGVEADHAGERAGWRRAADETCIPLCRKHHQDRTENRGFFGPMTREERLQWRFAAIARTQSRHTEWRRTLDEGWL